MATLPRFNKLSQAEIFYAPQLMQQQEDIAESKNEELLNELANIKYLSGDKALAEPHIKEYNDKINELSKKLVTEGYSTDIKNKILDLRKQYISDTKLKNLQANYKTAQEGWNETKQLLQREGASADALNRFKNAYFSGYTGAYDAEGNYQEFTPGATSSYYDMQKDVSDVLNSVGKTGSIVGKDGSSVKFVPEDPNTGVAGHYEVYNSDSGQYVSTANQIEAAKEYLKSQYSPTNMQSDRGLFSRTMQYDPDYINNMIDQLGSAKVEGYYQTLPKQSVNFTGFGTSSAGTATPTTEVARIGFEKLPGLGKSNTSAGAVAQEKLLVQKAKQAGLNVTSMDELQKLAAPINDAMGFASFDKRVSGLLDKYVHQNPQIFTGMNSQQKAAKELSLYNDIAKELGYGDALTANNLLRDSKKYIENELPVTDQDVPFFSINSLAIAKGMAINEIDTLNKGLTSNLNRFNSSFAGTTKKENEAFESIKDNITDIIGFSYDTRYGLVCKVRGEDSDKESKDALIILPSSEFDKEAIFVKFLKQLDPEIATQYENRLDYLNQ